ncbi:MAG TPA: phosphatase PAP2 family protein [Acetobacteraceae bacterium]|nr:phosphatase PAP2 family protein [Acetobacteraceae bacterium]
MLKLNRTVAAIVVPCAAVAAIWGADLAWAAQSGLRLVGIGYLAIALLLLAGNFAFYRRRDAGDRSAALVSGYAMFFAIASGTALMSYLAATLDRPLADPWLARADAALGFHWLDWFHFVRAHHLLHGLLATAYATMFPQVLLCLFALPLSGMVMRNRELLALFAVSMVPTLILFALFPAACPWVYFDAQPGFVAVHMIDLQALRSGAFPVLDLQRIHGLVTFPSYHAAVAVLLVYIARGTRFVFLSAVVNGLMLLSALSEGGHYLVDLIAGVAIALGTILVVRRAMRWVSGSGVPAHGAA